MTNTGVFAIMLRHYARQTCPKGVSNKGYFLYSMKSLKSLPEGKIEALLQSVDRLNGFIDLSLLKIPCQKEVELFRIRIL